MTAVRHYSDRLIAKMALNPVSHDGLGERFVMANFARASSLWLAVLVTLLLGQRSSLAQEVRFALVIGNDQYRAATLATPANDAGLVADALGAAGFAVTGARNLDQAALWAVSAPSNAAIKPPPFRPRRGIQAAPAMDRAAFRPTRRQMQR
jgi:hypothetical protein